MPCVMLQVSIQASDSLLLHITFNDFIDDWLLFDHFFLEKYM